MNHRKLAQIIKLLRENNVSHLKTLELDITLEPTGRPFVAPTPALEPANYAPKSEASAPPVESDIPHHENEVKKLLSLSDEELVDKIFPVEPTPGAS